MVLWGPMEVEAHSPNAFVNSLVDGPFQSELSLMTSFLLHVGPPKAFPLLLARMPLETLLALVSAPT